MTGVAEAMPPPDAIQRRDVLGAEMTKITTLPMTVIMVIIAAVANFGLAAVDVSGVRFSTGSTPARLSTFGMVMLAPVYVFLVAPVTAAASEHRDGQFRMSLVAVPDRRLLAGAAWLAMMVGVMVGAVVALAPARLVVALVDQTGVAAFAIDLGRWVAVYLFLSMIAYGLARLLRQSIAPLAIMIGLPVIIGTGILQWPQGIRFLPDQASLSLLGTPGYDVTELPVGVAALVLAGWSVLATVTHVLAVTRRDA